MLYDHNGKPIRQGSGQGSPEVGKGPPRVGERLVRWEPSDRVEDDASRNLNPTRLDAIFREANRGDPRSQARLAREIREKDWDSAHALGTREAAVLGCEWDVTPRDGLEDDAGAKRIAEETAEMLRGVGDGTRLRNDALPGGSGGP